MSNLPSRAIALLGLTATTLVFQTATGHVQLNRPSGGESLGVGEVFSVEWTIVVPHDLENWDLFYSTTSGAGPWTVIGLDLPAGNSHQGSLHRFDWTVPDDPSEEAWIRVVMDNFNGYYDDVNSTPFSIVAPGLGCDFDQDGQCTVVDLNALLAEGPIHVGVPVTVGVNDQFDLDVNGVIDSVDANLWLEQAGPANGFSSGFLPADADLNGFVDVSDFNRWNEHRFDASLQWDHGDFNGDGQVDVSDFNIWNANKFRSSDALTVVPEPLSQTLAMVWMAMVAVAHPRFVRRAIMRPRMMPPENARR